MLHILRVVQDEVEDGEERVTEKKSFLEERGKQWQYQLVYHLRENDEKCKVSPSINQYIQDEHQHYKDLGTNREFRTYHVVALIVEGFVLAKFLLIKLYELCIVLLLVNAKNIFCLPQWATSHPVCDSEQAESDVKQPSPCL